MNVDMGTVGTEGAVVASAEALFNVDPVGAWVTWDFLTDVGKEPYRRRARVAIDAYLQFYYGETTDASPGE